MAKPATRSSTQTAATGKGRRKAVPDVSAQDGVVGAGTVSSLFVIWQYATGSKLPTELVAALTPFAGLAISIALAFGRRVARTRRERREAQEYERDIEIFLTGNFSEEAKALVRKEWEEMRVISIAARRQRILETMAGASASASDG